MMSLLSYSWFRIGSLTWVSLETQTEDFRRPRSNWRVNWRPDSRGQSHPPVLFAHLGRQIRLKLTEFFKKERKNE